MKVMVFTIMVCPDLYCTEGRDRGSPALFECKNCRGRGIVVKEIEILEVL